MMKKSEEKNSAKDNAKLIAKDAGRLLLACLYVPIVLIGVARKIKAKK